MEQQIIKFEKHEDQLDIQIALKEKLKEKMHLGSISTNTKQLYACHTKILIIIAKMWPIQKNSTLFLNSKF